MNQICEPAGTGRGSSRIIKLIRIDHLGTINVCTRFCVYIRFVDVETFYCENFILHETLKFKFYSNTCSCCHSESQIPISWWYDGKSKWITKCIKVHPLGIMNTPQNLMAVHRLCSCSDILDISAWTKVMDWHCRPWCRDLRIPPSITYRDFCLSTRLLVSVIFSVEAMSPSPACVCQPATSTRPKKRRLIQLTRCTLLPLHVSCETVGPGGVDSVWQPDQPAALRSAATDCVYLGMWRRSSCDCCLPRCQSSAASRPPAEAVVVSSKSLEQMSGHKTSSHIYSPQVHLIMNQSAGLCFIMFYHMFSSGYLLPVFFSLPEVFYLTRRPLLTWTDEPVTLSCSAGWCITRARAYSQNMCFFVTTSAQL